MSLKNIALVVSSKILKNKFIQLMSYQSDCIK